MNEPQDETGARRRRFRSVRLGGLLLEVFSIVLGVLLALAVSEWQEQRNNVERAALALSNVRGELISNLELSNAIHANNSRVIEAMDDPSSTAGEDQNIIPGVQMRSSAWETLGATGSANHVAYQTLLELSQLYAIIGVYREMGYAVINATMNSAAMAAASGRTVDNALYAANFRAYFEVVLKLEATLIDELAAAIEALDASSGAGN